MRYLKATAFSISLIGLLELLILVISYVQGAFYPTLLELLLVGGFPLVCAVGVFFLFPSFPQGLSHTAASSSQIRVCFRRFSLLHLGFSVAMIFWCVWRLVFPAAIPLLLLQLAIVSAADRRIKDSL